MLGDIKADLKKNYYDPSFHGVDIEARFKEADEKIKNATSLGQIFGRAAPPPGATAPPVTAPLTSTGGLTGTVPLSGTARTVVLQIQEHLLAAQAAAGRGDWATYGKEQAAAYRLIKAALGQSR